MGPGSSTVQRPSLGMPLQDLDTGLDRLFDISCHPSVEQEFNPLELCDFKVIAGPRDVVVRAELPEFEQELFDIRVRDDILTIKVERQERSGRQACFHTFSRKVTLPCGLNPERMQIASHNGTLEIRLPRAQEKPR